MTGDAIKAGDYELVAEMWDEQTSEPGKPFEFTRHRKGDIVSLNIEHARRLVLAGAVVEPGAAERARVEALRVQYEAALAALGPKPPEVAAGSSTEQDGGDDAALPEHLRSLKTVADLRAYAGTNDIDLEGYTLKADILAAIIAAEAA